MLASIFLVGGANALRNAPALAAKAEPVTDRVVPAATKAMPSLPIPQDPALLVRINALTQIAAGLTLARGRAPRTSSALLASTLVPTTLAGHRFWEVQDSSTRQQQQLHFFKNLSILGGLLIAAGDTDGRPSVAWRTRRAVSKASLT